MSLPQSTTSAPRRGPSPHAPELLAPAGDWEALRAAVANGADAVYFGLANFNARHRATNFARDELPAVMEFLHRRNVRGYVALNTLIFSDELAEVAALAPELAAARVDAVILQDLGLARLIRRIAPGLPLHGSTQMTLTEPRGIEFVAGLGIERVILARELSLADVKRIGERTRMPLEVFVHGALCIAYSGQCLTSEALGGRSANRGQCAQACRLPYELFVDGQPRELGDRAYLLSPQDLAAHDRVADLARLGVASLKIEGRLKSPHYVAITTRTYRQAIEAAEQGRIWSPTAGELADLAQSYSRGFTTGFLDGVNHQALVAGRFPKSRGVRLGVLHAIARHGVVVALDEQVQPDAIKPGDGVVFDEGHPEQDEQGGRVYEVLPVDGSSPSTAGAPRLVEIQFGQGAINAAALAPGCLVWKTDDPALRRRLEQTYSRDVVPRRVPLSFSVTGRPGDALTISAAVPDLPPVDVHWPGPLQPAQKHPLDEATARQQLGRLGNSRYQLEQVTLDLPDAVMVPRSVLNDLRRQALEQLDRAADAAYAIQLAEPAALEHWRAEIAAKQTGSVPLLARPAVPNINDDQPRLYVLTRTLDQLEAVLAWSTSATPRRVELVYCDFEDVRRYRQAVDLARAAGQPIGLATLRISKPEEEGLLRQIARQAPDAFLVRNLAGVELLRDLAPDIPRVGDYSLNVANELTADVLFSAGLARLTPSYDLNFDQLAAMLGRIDPGLFEVVIHQHMPMFHMEHCVFAALLSEGKDHRDCGRPCDHHRIELRDRAGAPFPVLADTGCRNTVFNSTAQSAAEYIARMRRLGVRHYRVELLRERGAEVAPLLDRYDRVLTGLEAGRDTWRQLRVLNQLGVTRGTLSAE